MKATKKKKKKKKNDGLRFLEMVLIIACGISGIGAVFLAGSHMLKAFLAFSIFFLIASVTAIILDDCLKKSDQKSPS